MAHPAFFSRIFFRSGMRISRPTILLAAAALAALWVIREADQREKTPSATQVPPRPGEMGKAETATWLRNEIQASADPRWSSPRKADLALACSTLGTLDRIALLEEIEQWRKGPTFGQSNQLRLRLLRLQPLRNQLLEQAAQEDLETILRLFPSGAEVLLKAAARKNGSETLKVWNEIRDEWRGLNRYSPPLDSVWIEGIGDVPTIRDEDEETSASAALAEGWASSDPEAAWTALSSGQMKGLPVSAILKGFFRGLPEPADWSTWTDRLESLSWNDPRHLSENGPRGMAVTALARRWLESDPDQAIAWFLHDEASWTSETRVWFPSEKNSFNAGITGRTTYVSPHAFLLADWMKAQPKAAAAWLANASEAFAPPDILREIVAEMEIPSSMNARIAARCGD